MTTTNADVALFTTFLLVLSNAFPPRIEAGFGDRWDVHVPIAEKARITREPRVSLSGAYQAWVPPQCGQPTDVETGASNT